MAILSQIPNGASNKDIRDSINNILTTITTLQAQINQLSSPLLNLVSDRPAPTASAPKTLPDGTTTLTNVGYNQMFVEADFTGDQWGGIYLMAPNSGDINLGHFKFVQLTNDFYAGLFRNDVDGYQRRTASKAGQSSNSEYKYDEKPSTGPFRLRAEISDKAVRFFKSPSTGTAPGPIGTTPLSDYSLLPGSTAYYEDGGEKPLAPEVLKILAKANHTSMKLEGNPKNIVYGEYTPFSPPLTITSASLLGSFKPSITFTYFGSKLSYGIQLERNDGSIISAAKPATVVENAAQGTATVTGSDAIPDTLVGTPITFRLIEYKNGTATGVSRTTLLSRPKPLTIGSNAVRDTARAAFTNAAAFSDWQDPRWYNNDPLGKSGSRDPGEGVNGVFMGYNGGPINCPAGTEMRQNITRLPTNGATYEISWSEPKNSTSNPLWTPFFHSANEQTHVTSDVTNAVKANNRFSKRFKCSYDVNSPQQAWIIWYGQGDLEEIDIREVSLVGSTERIRQSYVDFLKLLPGPIRYLEIGNFNNSGQNYEWANRPKRSSFGKTGYQIGGEPIEDMIERCNRSNRDMWICVPTLWTQTLFNDYINAIFTGAKTDNNVALKSNLNLYIELVGNEPWNPGLFYYRSLAEKGWADGFKTFGTDENGARLFAQARRSATVLGWIKSTFSQYADRTIDVVGLHPANDRTEYDAMKGFGLADSNGKPLFKSVAQSIYFGIGAKEQRYGSATPADMLSAFSLDYKNQGDNFQKQHAYYLADGVRHLIYEVGTDMAGNVYSAKEKEVWLNSAEHTSIYGRELRRLKTTTGDVVCLYWDVGLYEQSGFGSWGHWQAPGMTSAKADIVLVVQAESNSGT